jgi:hypothetical protein
MGPRKTLRTTMAGRDSIVPKCTTFPDGNLENGAEQAEITEAPRATLA